MNAKKLFFILGNDCQCPPTYTEGFGGMCEKTDIINPSITSLDYCLAPSRRVEYAGYKSRIYNPNHDNNTIHLDPGVGGDILAEMAAAPQWRNTNAANGPMNRAGVWIDKNCDGVKDALGGPLLNVHIQNSGSGYTNGVYNFVPLNTSTGTGSAGTVVIVGGSISAINVTVSSGLYSGNDLVTFPLSSIGNTGSGAVVVVSNFTPTKVTLASNYNNTGSQRTVYVGIAADNQFTLKANDTIIATSDPAPTNQYNFYIWHMFPVTLVPGWNYFNAVGTGDGSINDSIGMTVYDNTPAELIAASGDNNAGLNVLFSSEQLIGQHIDVATCAPGYNLDTSLGQGNYRCVRTITTACE